MLGLVFPSKVEANTEGFLHVRFQKVIDCLPLTSKGTMRKEKKFRLTETEHDERSKESHGNTESIMCV